jgi:hypothetical protein
MENGMKDETHDDAHRPGGAAQRPETHEPTKATRERSGGANAGQEARRGVPPGEHDDEHQSNYGGGGTHGGVK